METIGVTKARLPALAVFMLAVLAGGFIGLGALYCVIVAADPALSVGGAGLVAAVYFVIYRVALREGRAATRPRGTPIRRRRRRGQT